MLEFKCDIRARCNSNNGKACKKCDRRLQAIKEMPLCVSQVPEFEKTKASKAKMLRKRKKGSKEQPLNRPKRTPISGVGG